MYMKTNFDNSHTAFEILNQKSSFDSWKIAHLTDKVIEGNNNFVAYHSGMVRTNRSNDVLINYVTSEQKSDLGVDEAQIFSTD